jgi:hypothetical protein
MHITLNKIEILWEGPFTFDKVSELNNNNDYGLYQIYGTHSIYGIDTLLYIGKAQEQKFSVRLSQHQEWLAKEINEIKFYVGRLGANTLDENENDFQEWGNDINVAEKLLIYFSAPAYNTSNLNQYGKLENTIVLNLGKKMMLPFEVSTAYYDSNYWKQNETWKTYYEK